MDALEERDSRDPAQEQLGTVVRGVVQERVHDGLAQARREIVPGIEGGRRTPLGHEGARGRGEQSAQQFPADAQSGVGRPPDLDDNDARHPHVHGQSVRAAERRGERLQLGTDYIQGLRCALREDQGSLEGKLKGWSIFCGILKS